MISELMSLVPLFSQLAFDRSQVCFTDGAVIIADVAAPMGGMTRRFSGISGNGLQ